uniref:HAT C-terminal dimerisation domain-containing protein n=2 Tax=Anopheles atroparvus TaxID=41427 RepID=A0AAG5DQS5_ANOAO
MFNETKEKVNNSILKAKYISLTTDGWTNYNNVSFFAITGHFINEDGYLQTLLLKCSEFALNHTAVNIAEWIQNIMEEYDIKNKVVAVVTDNATNMKAAINILKLTHIPCFAHSLNIIVQTSLKTSIKRIIDEVKSIVQHFKKSATATQKLMQMQKNLKYPVLKLKQDVPTRWNSTYDMLERFVLNKKPLLSCLAILNIKTNLTDRDWETINKALEILKLFKLATEDVSAEKSVTLSKMGVLCRILLDRMLKIEINGSVEIEISELVNSLIKGIREKYAPYFSNELVQKSILLDPRHKKHGFFDDKLKFRETYDLVLNELKRLLARQNELTTEQTETLPQTTEQSNPLWGDYDAKKRLNVPTTNSTAAAINELGGYLKDQDLGIKEDSLIWWQKNKHAYPNLYEIILRIMCIPATSVPCERIFSKAGNILTDRRNRLTPKKMEEVLFLKYNFDG